MRCSFYALSSPLGPLNFLSERKSSLSLNVKLTSLTDHSLREADHAFSELERFLNAEITAKERELALEKDGEMGVSTTSKNLFSRVVLASQLDGPGGLTRDEIRGNLFIYLFAGVCPASTPLIYKH